ncbi:MAG: hypothetical protein DRI71_05470 [Bacteroidetes bacterium]|nr:MAG: hypothetical protein DRI71_05470 [Bacteroidota bacterium]
MIILFLLSGLLIGFALGYQDLFLLLGAGSKRKKKSVWYLVIFASIALFTGALTNTDGSLAFVGELTGVKQIQVAFMILASALITTTLLRIKFRIISVSHAVIGSITGWLLFVDNTLPLNKLLAIIIIWLVTPILSAFLSAGYLTLLKSSMRRLHLHILKIGRTLQILLSIALLVGAYSIGANNIANVAGVYLPVFEGTTIHILDKEINTEIALVFIGALAITIGLLVRLLFKTKKQDLEIFEFSPETNFSVMASFATVFFLFSSTIFQDLIGQIGLSYPLVPISTLHILTAGVVGVSYKKGFNVYQKDSFAGLAVGSILTPVMSGLIMFVSALAFKSFWLGLNPKSITSNTGHSVTNQEYLNQFFSINDSSVIYNLGVILLLTTIIILGIAIYTRMQRRFNLERERFSDNKAELEAEKDFFKKELSYSEEKTTILQHEIDFKNKELEKFAFSLLEKEEILKKLKDILALVKTTATDGDKKEVISGISNLMLNNLNLSNEKISFYQSVDEMNRDFYIRLSQQFNNLTNNDKRLIAFLKLGLSSKEISSLINISTKSVEMNRYRLRQKLSLLNDQNLLDFVNNI